MTGIFVQIRRGDRWEAVEVEHLTEDELATLKRERPLDGWYWTTQLTRWIRERVRVKPEDVTTERTENTERRDH